MRREISMKKFLALLAIVCLLAAPMAHADDIWTMAQSDNYGRKAGGMFLRGLLNAGSCFVDLIVQTVEGTKSGPPFIGTVAGIGKGAGCTVLRAASGVVDVATFWVPGFNGFPCCKSYKDCISCSQGSQAAPSYQPPPAEVVQQATPAPAQDSPMRYVKK